MPLDIPPNPPRPATSWRVLCFKGECDVKFDEKGDVYTFVRCSNCLVYFLLQDDEVVYVGQTSVGLSRPFSHNDKKFNLVKVLPCSIDKLNETEDFYIEKYKPKYNKCRNYSAVYSLNKVKTLIREYYYSKFNVWDLRKILNKLDISPFRDEYTNGYYITIEQYHTIEKYIKGSLT
jgi:hypothetical protein